MVRRQRERERQQKRREKQAARAERRELKKATAGPVVDPDDPMNDPTIDWGNAVRETELEEVPEELQVDEEVVTEV
jgi:hypothetical protein